MNLENIRIVLIRTFHPGNIGSAARSMKTMGLSNLHLVAPKDFPSDEAHKMAAGATDVVDSATLHPDIESAVTDCTMIAATTARPRGYDLPCLTPEQAANKLLEGSSDGPVALLFGPERMGLHNADLELAKYRVTIPANPEYSSLNLAAAVQTVSYEICKASSLPLQENTTTRELPTALDIERLHEHLERVLKDIKFLRPHQGETLQRIRNLVARAEPDTLELNILRGILTAIEKTKQK